MSLDAEARYTLSSCCSFEDTPWTRRRFDPLPPLARRSWGWSKGSVDPLTLVLLKFIWRCTTQHEQECPHLALHVRFEVAYHRRHLAGPRHLTLGPHAPAPLCGPPPELCQRSRWLAQGAVQLADAGSAALSAP